MPEQAKEPELSWVGVDELPVEFANIFAVLVGENAVVLNLGTLVPPMVDLDDDGNYLVPFVPVKPITRVALTLKNLDGLIETLQDARKDHIDLGRELNSED